MKTRMWMVVVGIALAIVAAIAIAPAVLARGPAGGYGPGMNRAQMMDGMPGPGMGMCGGMGPMQGRRGGMHDGLRYRRTSDGWAVERLAP